MAMGLAGPRPDRWPAPALAIALAGEGALLVLSARRADRLEALRDRLAQGPHTGPTEPSDGPFFSEISFFARKPFC